MRADEIRDLTDDEIQTEVGQLQEELFRLRYRAATEALENPMLLKSIRRDVARLKTVLRERQLGIGRT